MPRFLDINVWLPLLWEGHAAHAVARKWASSEPKELVVCRVTQMGLLRHLCNPVIMGADVLSNRAASGVVSSLTVRSGVRFSPEPAGLDSIFPRLGESTEPQRNRWTDAYLAAFAISGGFELVSFDREFARYEEHGLTWQLLTLQK